MTVGTGVSSLQQGAGFGLFKIDEFSMRCGLVSGSRVRSLCFAVACSVVSPLYAEPAVEAVANDTSQEDHRFNIWEFRVEGNSLLENRRIERVVYSYLGPKKTIRDVDAAVAALNQEYRQEGYPTVLVDIPEQEVKEGVVRLRVTEGKVDRLRISGSRYYSLGRIREELPALAQGNVPHLPTVQKQMLAMGQETGDRVITPVMRPGRTPGTLEVELKVKDELPLHGSLEVNGRNSANTTRNRVVGMLRYDNLWQRMHSFSLQYQSSPENTDEVQVLAATYMLPLGNEGNKLVFYGIRSESNSEVASAGALSVLGEGTIAGTRLVLPLEGSEQYFHTLSLGADYKDFKEGVLLAGADTLNTPISYLPLSLRYDGTVRGENAITSFGVGATFGIRDLVGTQEEFEDKRIFSQANFFYLSGDFNRRQSLPRDFELRGRLAWQLAGSPLISNEQFSAGGAESVRGYFESQVLGDDGLLASLELHSPFLGKRDWASLQDLHALLFVEGATLRIREPLPGNAHAYDLASAGFGLRLQALEHLKAALDLAYPFQSNGTVEEGETRLHFRLAYEF